MTDADSSAALGELYHSTPYAGGFPYDEWMHIGTLDAALERARSIHPEDFGLPSDTPVYLHTVRLRGQVYPRMLTDEQATSLTGNAHPIRDVDEGMPPGLGYQIFRYRNDGEDKGSASYLVHRSAIVPVRQEAIQRNQLLPEAGADYVSLPDGGALVERETCTCGQSVTLFRGVRWNDNDTPHDCDDLSPDIGTAGIRLGTSHPVVASSPAVTPAAVELPEAAPGLAGGPDSPNLPVAGPASPGKRSTGTAMVAVNSGVDGMREEWRPGDQAWFEYHCQETPDSVDAALWYRSHQQVHVLGRADDDAWDALLLERLEEGMPRVYRVLFADGHAGDVVEDELLTGPQWFSRPAPPAAPSTARAHPDTTPLSSGHAAAARDAPGRARGLAAGKEFRGGAAASHRRAASTASAVRQSLPRSAR